MYERITGTLIEKEPSRLVVETYGIGYAIHVPISLLGHLPDIGQTVTLMLHTYVREDQLRLYGFHTATGRDLFGRLIGISGVGPAVALAILGGASVRELKDAVHRNQPEILQRVKGIGKKTAARIIVEMGEIIDSFEVEDDAVGTESDNVFDDAVAALVTLGHKPDQARSAVTKAIQSVDSDADVQEVIKEALRLLHR